MKMTCVVCPMGCRLDVEFARGDEISVSGNRCPRGAVYAREELVEPKRSVTATCRAAPSAAARGIRRIPCKSASPFPKEKVGELLSEIHRLKVPLPVTLGQVLIRDAIGSGIDVVATRSID